MGFQQALGAESIPDTEAVDRLLVECVVQLKNRMYAKERRAIWVRVDELLDRRLELGTIKE